MNTELVFRYGERFLILLGILLVCVTGTRILSYHLFQKSAALASLPHSRPVSLTTGGLKVTGELEIPRLGLSVMVVDGDEEQGLRVAAVHLADTAQIGSPGNAVIAGHRDTSFWPLRNLRTGDVIWFRGARTDEYRVLSMRVISPDDTSVLAASKTPIITS